MQAGKWASSEGRHGGQRARAGVTSCFLKLQVDVVGRTHTARAVCVCVWLFVGWGGGLGKRGKMYHPNAKHSVTESSGHPRPTFYQGTVWNIKQIGVWPPSFSFPRPFSIAGEKKPLCLTHIPPRGFVSVLGLKVKTASFWCYCWWWSSAAMRSSPLEKTHFQSSSHTSSPLRFNQTQLGQQWTRELDYTSYVKQLHHFSGQTVAVFTAL